MNNNYKSGLLSAFGPSALELLFFRCVTCLLEVMETFVSLEAFFL